MPQVTGYNYNDFTSEILNVPNQWGLIEGLNVFTSDSVSSSVVQFDETTQTSTLIKDQRRGTRKQVNADNYSKLHTVGVPHFPFDDVIRPEDIINRRMPGDKDESDTLARVRLQKMERLRRSWASTLEYARMQALMGVVYNPNQTNDVQNWFTEFGATQVTVDYVLDTATTDVIAKGEAAIASCQDNILSGEQVSDFVAICSPEFFSSLIAHPNVKEAYTYYSSTQEPLRNRLTSSMGARYREFEYGGIRYIEYRGSFAGNVIVPANEAYLVPLGTTDTFITYFAPADRLWYVNTAGLPQYMWEFPDDRGHLIEIESESNFLNMVRRPQSVVRLHRDLP